MNIIINGDPTTVENNISLAHLITSLKLSGAGIVIELNKEAVFPREYDTLALKNDDHIEIVTVAAGG